MLQKDTAGDRAFLTVVRLLMILVIVITAYPILYTVSNSVSDPLFVATRQVTLLPKGFSLEAYRFVLRNSELYMYLGNSLFYALSAVALNVSMCVLLAYPLSRRDFVFRKPAMILVTMTMFFNGGMIPNFLLIRSLGIYNTRAAMILPAAISVYNLIITRTFIEKNIHESLIESATIDGSNDFQTLLWIVLPMCSPILAVLFLFVAVDRWNSYLDALLYLNDSTLQPIQVYLRRILLLSSMEDISDAASESLSSISLIGYQIKYAVVIVTMAPVMCIYPFIQKYFTKGISLGSVKE